jgi:hypothetical protein
VRSPSAGWRSDELESKATKRPSAEIAGWAELPSPVAPAAPAARLTRAVVFACRSRSKTWLVKLRVTSGSRFPANEEKVT